MDDEREHDIGQVGPGEKLGMSLDTSDTLVALVSVNFALHDDPTMIWIWILPINFLLELCVHICANQVLRQAVSDSLDTFASFVNTACESDLDGEVMSSSLSAFSNLRSWLVESPCNHCYF